MKPTRKTLAASIIVAGLAAAGPALSAESASLPPLQVQGAVSYVTGGIGVNEAAAFKHAAAAYPLEMMFVQKAGAKNEFVADVKISLTDRSGAEVLDATAEGPFLLASLPAGKYAIEAVYRGERKHQTVEIRPGAHRRAVFIWEPRDKAEQRILGSTTWAGRGSAATTGTPAQQRQEDEPSWLSQYERLW